MRCRGKTCPVNWAGRGRRPGDRVVSPLHRRRMGRRSTTPLVVGAHGRSGAAGAGLESGGSLVDGAYAAGVAALRRGQLEPGSFMSERPDLAAVKVLRRLSTLGCHSAGSWGLRPSSFLI